MGSPAGKHQSEPNDAIARHKSYLRVNSHCIAADSIRLRGSALSELCTTNYVCHLGGKNGHAHTIPTCRRWLRILMGDRAEKRTSLFGTIFSTMHGEDSGSEIVENEHAHAAAVATKDGRRPSINAGDTQQEQQQQKTYEKYIYMYIYKQHTTA